MVPLAADHSLGVAIISYDGRLFFGLVADRDVPDLDVLADGLRHALEELAALAAVERPRARSPRREQSAAPPPSRSWTPTGSMTVVERAQAAARAFRELDQEAVDRIVWAMVGGRPARARSSSPSWRWRRPASACSRTRWSRTTSPPSSSTTT